MKFFLDVVPKEYIIGIIKKKSYSKNILKKMLEEITNKKIIDPESSLQNLSRQALIDLLIEFHIISLEDAKENYVEFRDGKNPIFYLYKFDESLEKKDIFKTKKELDDLFKSVQLNRECKFTKNNIENNFQENEEPYKYKDFGIINFKIFKEEVILEISFEYLERIDYLSENYIPEYVYALKNGFFWLDLKNQLIIIKCQNDSINEALINLLEAFFSTKIWKFKLRKDIVDHIFDRKEMIKNYLTSRSNSDPNLFNSIIIKDIEFERKSKDPKFSFIVEYERRSSSYRTKIEGFSRKINVEVAENGKISLKGRTIKIDRCREWLIKILNQILKIHQEFKLKNEISSYIRANDFIERTLLYKNIKNQKAREKIYELIEKIIFLKNNPAIENVEFLFPMAISYYFNDFLIPYPNLRCPFDDCNRPLLCPNENCDSFRFEIKKDIINRKFYLKCLECNEVLEDKCDLECVDYHNIQFNIEDSIYYVFNLNLKIELNKIFKGLDLGFEIKNDIETYYIKENKLYRREILNKIIYNYDDLPAFQDIPKIQDLSDKVKKNQAQNIKDVLEKCSNSKRKCRNCHLKDNEKDLCLLRIFSKYSNGQAHPHTGTEFGDFEFPQKFSTGLENIIGIAKSYRKPSEKNAEKIFDTDFDKLTFKKNDNLFEQFFQLCMEETVRFIMIVSGRIIDSSLKNAIYEIAKMKQKKVVIIEPKDLIPIFSYYFSDLSYKTS
ncbi:MAG: hypothetical protein ACTSRH_02420 [Promethearchaeota archaeon]